jgi:ABC-type lipoprotein release transport system permease subunit
MNEMFVGITSILLYDGLPEGIREHLDEKIEGDAQRIRCMPYGVQPLSVFTFVALITIIVAVCASALPAWRASRLDPVEALRNE